MTTLVTLAEVKAHLRLYSDHEDADLTLKLSVAEGLIGDFITADLGELTPGQEARVKAATLLVVGGLYHSRGDGESSPLISETVENVLYGLRDPTLA